MKFFYPFFVSLVLMSGSANAFWGGDYLTTAASAWADVLGASGRGGAIARQLDTAKSVDLPVFYNLVSSLAYNDTALTLFEASAAIRTGFSFIDSAPCERRTAARRVSVDARILGRTADFDRNDNSDFNVDTTGGGMGINFYVTDGMTLGVAYARTATDTHSNSVYTDGDTDIVTLYARYAARGGFFMNIGVLGGRVAWDVDKTIAGVADDSAFDTDFMAGRVAGGYQISLGRATLTPSAAVQYSRIITDKHIDAAAQAFEKWWYNRLAASAAMRLGYDFDTSGVTIRPSISLGGGYAAINHGTDRIAVGVIDVGRYDMPVIAPSRLWFDGGVALGVRGEMFALGFEYNVAAYSDYTSHGGSVHLKIAF